MKKITRKIGLILAIVSTVAFMFNTQVGGTDVLVGDVNNDGVVSLADLIMAAKAFGSYPGHPRWNALADINDDGRIDMNDLYAIVRNFGETGEVFIAAIVKICPHALNLRSRGRWIVACIELPEGYDLHSINVSTIMLNGTIPAESKPFVIGDFDCDGLPNMIVMFERRKVIDLIVGNYPCADKFGHVTLIVSGKVDNATFQGSDCIKIINKCCQKGS